MGDGKLQEIKKSLREKFEIKDLGGQEGVDGDGYVGRRSILLALFVIFASFLVAFVVRISWACRKLRWRTRACRTKENYAQKDVYLLRKSGLTAHKTGEFVLLSSA